MDVAAALPPGIHRGKKCFGAVVSRQSNYLERNHQGSGRHLLSYALGLDDDAVATLPQLLCSRSALHGLAVFSRVVLADDATLLGQMDGPQWREHLRAMSADHPHARLVTARLLERARRHPVMDPRGLYASHLHAVPAVFLERHPVLWKYPARFAVWLMGLPQDGTVDRVLRFSETVVLGRLSRASVSRMEDRARRAVFGGV
jgi:hypothetical protein